MARPASGSFHETLNRYLTVFVLLLFVLVPPVLCSLFYLSQVPDVMWQHSNQPAFDRIWMYRTRRPAGIGYQSQRVVETYSPSEVCVQNKVRFLLWAKAEGVSPSTSRQLMVLNEDGWQATGQSCP